MRISHPIHQASKGAVALALTLSLLSSCGKEMRDSNGLPVMETEETWGPIVPEEGPAPDTAVAMEDTEETRGPIAEDQDPAEVQAEDSLAWENNLADGAEVLAAAGSGGGTVLPPYQSSWGLTRSVYNKAQSYLRASPAKFKNRTHVAVMDMNLHSSKKRLFIFNLKTGAVEKYHVAHGKNSDPAGSGYAKKFSNQANSKMTALGVYRTAGTYKGKHGTSMRLEGLEKTNSRSLSRGTVMHSASYVNEKANRVGRSWGCPAVSPKYIKRLLSSLNGQAMFVIWK